jgi:peptide subunit release factor 1 (eRF1)
MTQTIERRIAEPHVAEAAGPLIDRLAAIEPERHHVVSCYVRLGPRDRVRAQYLGEIRSRARAVGGDPMMLDLGGEEADAVRRDLDRIVACLERPGRLPHARGLAIFACEALELFEAIPLPQVYRTRLILDDTPWIAELVALQDEMDPILVVLIDRAHLRFFEVSPMAVTELPGLTGAASRGGRFHSGRGDAPGWGERDYHGRMEEERHRRYASAAEHLEALARGRPVRGIVLAGPADHTSALSRFLPGRLPRLLLGAVKLNPTAATPARVQAAVLAAAEEHDRTALAAELLALEEALGTGWAVDDSREALRALSRGQVRTLFVQEGLSGGGFRCAATGRLVLAKADCGGEGEPRPVRHLVDEAIEEGLHQRARVVMVPRQAAADVVEGLAATLRFR